MACQGRGGQATAEKESQREEEVAEGRLVTEERGADGFFMEKT